jgi:phosphoglycerate dehydrogenase-like enzyme
MGNGGCSGMETLRVFCDVQASDDLLDLLRCGIAPHVLLTPQGAATSVLADVPTDPLLQEADIAFGQPQAADVLSAPRLKWLQVSSAGYTRYDTKDFRNQAVAKGLAVTNSSHVYDQACAEHALSFLFAQARLLPESLTSMAANGDDEWLSLRGRSVLLQGQSVLLLGYGEIAKRMLPMLQALQMDVTGYRRSPRGDEGIPMVGAADLSAALASADHVVNILPENPDSRSFCDAAFFSKMKPGSVFYNIGRGATVDQTALHEALMQRHLQAAWLDVTSPEPLPGDHPLRELSNCHITPHVAGGFTLETRVLIEHFLKNFRRYLEAQPLANRVIY